MPEAASPLLLHIAASHDWQKAQSLGVYRPASLDNEGFIHCSTAVQVIDVTSRHFFGHDGLLLLCIDPARLAAEVRWENFVGTAIRFPHIYGPLNLDAVVDVLDLNPGADGRFGLSLALWSQIKMIGFDSSLPVPRPITLRGIHFDGSNHWFHPTTLIECRPDLLVLHTPLRQEVATDRGPWFSPYETTSYYWPDRYFNIVRLDVPGGLSQGWYCNVASPVIFDGEQLHYVDLELDVRVTIEPDGSLRAEAWDEDDFIAAIQRYGYSDELISRCREAAQQLVDMAAHREFPFDH